jgi:glycosyltransferase involved in cell wall biosynthesis
MNISIAMCTYNGSRFLGEQLKSLAEQTMLPSELIICDDASTDATSAIVKGFADGAPFPVRLIRNEVTLGSTKNFEKAICLCAGEAIALCDQDDIWQKDKLKRLAQVLECEPDVGGVFSDALLVDDKSKPMSDSLWEHRKFTPQIQADFNGGSAALMCIKDNFATGATFLFRSHFVKQVTPIPSEWVHDAWIALLIACLSRLRAVPERLVWYRLHPSQQIGIRSSTWGEIIHGERQTARERHQQSVKRWHSMTAKLSTLPVDPLIIQIAQGKLEFLETRRVVRDRSVTGRIVAATEALPGYFRFASGMLSYCRDLANI